VPSLKRDKNSRAEKIGKRSIKKTGEARGTEKRRGMPKRSGSLS